MTGDRLPLPKCSYLNTDFPGDDLILEDYTEPGINAGSARACKARCRLEETCSFWTYKEGFSRDTVTLDCFLKEGTPGLPVPREAVPRLGFVSGTQDNNWSVAIPIFLPALHFLFQRLYQVRGRGGRGEREARFSIGPVGVAW